MADVENHFTVFIRLPFARGDFVDPPQVDWSAAKERELWEELSRSSKGHEIEWKRLSERLQVTQPFLLQQAAWLYERQLSQVRAQMRKVGTRPSSIVTSTPQPGIISGVTSQPMKRSGSGGSRVPSQLSTQVAPSAEGSVPGTPLKAKSSFTNRHSSQAIVTQPRPEPNTETASRPLSRRASKDNEGQSRIQSRRGSIQQQVTRSPRQDIVHEVDSSSEEDMTQSRMLHRRPNPAASRRMLPSRKAQTARRLSAPQVDEEDEEDSPAFLPFSSNSTETTKAESSARDPSATIRGGMTQTARPATHRHSTSERIETQRKGDDGLTSSASSNSEVPAEPLRPRALENRQSGRGHLPNPLSPSQQAALAVQAGLSPRYRRTHTGGHGSDTSPSMGSSFSDLDDTSVTQSALEEALLSGMGNTTMTMGGPSGAVGNVANRVSGISQALRSRYFDARAGDSQR